MAREFTADREYRLTAAPERVWHAVATGAGNVGWLYPMEIEPRVGGEVSRGPSKVLAWEPPHRLVIRYADDKGFSNTLHYDIDGREDGGATLSMGIHWVHEGTPDANWDTKADAADKHIDFYQHSLRQYLEHFDGRPATYVRAEQSAPPAGPEAFAALRRRLGVPDGSAAGDRLRLTPDGIDPLDAEIDYLTEDFIGLRTQDGLYRFFDGSSWNWPIWLGHHLFAADADEDKATQVWRAWLGRA
ncbi:SRPBCC domain-containing protein [Kitasatospora aureofaciens]|uniref:SRPBCC domain-containing protein n=1 Tax=Kitasatospora aureofaciens TaxID=1894 RepID=UPI001C47C07C|nr:SRPBCC domain-containing protein [Kitasatospora aureofaciens]MBV6697679.1 SRPBCC domain-containing protein [Kitasatospora aureofaciens]